MGKLLRAGIRRYVRNILFWITLFVTVVVAVVASSSARNLYFDDYYCIIVFVAMAVMLSWMIGGENDDGIFRNKVICGYTKGQIYISEMILGVGCCLLMFFLFAVIFTVFNSYVFAKVSLSICIRIFVDSLLANVCFAVVLVTLSCLISKRAVAAIVSIILVLAIVGATYAVQSIVEQNEYNYEFDYEEIIETDDHGTHIMSMPVEGSEHKVKNPEYIEGPVRFIAETLYDILPYGHITEYTYITSEWFAYDYYKELTKDHPDYGLTWETSGVDFTVTEENQERINSNLIYSVIVNFVICLAGYVCFRRKELK